MRGCALSPCHVLYRKEYGGKEGVRDIGWACDRCCYAGFVWIAGGQVGYKGDSAYVAASVDPYDVQQAFCQRLGYTIDGEQITLYLDDAPITTVTNTVTDMGGFDNVAVWVGEQIRYDLGGKQPRVCITPGVKFVVGLILHYDDMPTFTAAVNLSEGEVELSDIKMERE